MTRFLWASLALLASTWLFACSSDADKTSNSVPTRPALSGSGSCEVDASYDVVANLTLERRSIPARTYSTSIPDLTGYGSPMKLRVRNGDEDGNHRSSEAWVWLDGEEIFGPDDFSMDIECLITDIVAAEGQLLEARVAGRRGSRLDVDILARTSAGSSTIGSDGGVVEILDEVQVDFPPGFFGGDRLVEVMISDDPEAIEAFEEFSGLFRVSSSHDRQYRLLAGVNAPNDQDLTVTLVVPQTFIIPPGHRPELFVRVWEDLGMATLDNFQLFPSVWDPTARTLTATLPAYVLTANRRIDEVFESFFTFATTPGFSSPLRGENSGGGGNPDDCMAAFLRCPLETECEVTSPFGERIHPITGKRSMHWGTDLRSMVGDKVIAPAKGIVERIRDQGNKGYGKYMILRHEDGSASLYGHLNDWVAPVGSTVDRGQEIAKAGNTGGSTGPHLHFEYVPNGEIVQNKDRIDPWPCIQDETVEGSITVRDNGSLADDAFSVFLDGTFIGSTEIGASNTFAINNLIPGEHTLSILGLIVPDNIGTYEVTLAQGITFSDGSTLRDGTVDQGETVAFTIVVPGATLYVSGSALSPRPRIQPEGEIGG